MRTLKSKIFRKAHKAAKRMRSTMRYLDKFAKALKEEYKKAKERKLGVSGMVKISSEVEKETEKAFLIFGVWFPKSQTKVCELGVFVSKWIFDKKRFELGTTYLMHTK